MNAPFKNQHARVLALALAVVLAGVGAACSNSTAAPQPNADRSQADRVDSGLIVNGAAAQRRHDWRLLRQFQAALIERYGLPAINDARESYARALADLSAASAAGDSRARATFRAELRAMCGPGGLVGAFEACDAHLITLGSLILRTADRLDVRGVPGSYDRSRDARAAVESGPDRSRARDGRAAGRPRSRRSRFFRPWYSWAARRGSARPGS